MSDKIFENGVVNDINGKNGHKSILEEDLNINASINKKFTYERVKEISDWLLERVSIRPKIAIVCGSGLGGLGDRIKEPKIFPYSSIPNFPHSTGNFNHMNNINLK